MSIRRISVFCGACFFIFYTHLLRSEENLSFGKTTTQSSTYRPSWNADRAVDGCLNQDISSNCCIHTADTIKEVWWQVDLGSLNTINYITIYYRDAFERRFAGYQLYLSNTTDWTQGNLCYEDTSKNLTEVELIVTHQCPYVARYVVVYNYRSYPKRHEWYDDFAILELCEVQVFGCPIQKHGYGNCNKNCSHNCYGGNCNGVTGSCFYCLPGKWGDACDQDCPTTCKTNTCIPNNGSCTECKPGRHGDVCDKYCPFTCNGTCDKVSSYCRGIHITKP
ncbi:uncharacterized protein LOC132554498 [Ylistrum balloti]|uniref:uncharacterized protein LOC132554498 n=1 Tax=Ylistrum balloti TaxID=509963 RepID=UPI002905CF7C|nr:uncharacterized protein LOC132554498 [Ylistrum balloti]